MKQYYFLLILCLFTGIANAQLTDYLTGLSGPHGMAVHGNYLYWTEYTGGKISRIDLTNNSATKEDFITGLSGPVALEFVGDNIFIAEYGGGKVSVSNVNNFPIPTTATDFKVGLGNPADIIYDGNHLYVSEFGNSRVIKVDPTNSSTPISTVKSINGCWGLALANDDLYVASLLNDIIYKVKTNLGANQPLSLIAQGFDGPFGIVLKDGNIYVADKTANKVSKINLQNAPVTTPDVLTSSANQPSALFFIGNDLYVAETGANKISKMAEAVLSVEEAQLSSAFLLPNPTVTFFSVQGAPNKSNITVFDINGRKIVEVDNYRGESIDTSAFSEGIYTVVVSTNVFKKIKKLVVAR